MKKIVIDYCLPLQMNTFGSIFFFMHGLKSAILAIFQKSTYWSLFVQPSETAHKIFFSISILIHFFKYEPIAKSSALSFSHSNPDPRSVNL